MALLDLACATGLSDNAAFRKVPPWRARPKAQGRDAARASVAAAHIIVPAARAVIGDGLRYDVIEEFAVVADVKKGTVPVYSCSSASGGSRVSMSRSLVGSSNTNTLAGRANRRANSSRARSPPDRLLTGEPARAGENREVAEITHHMLARAAYSLHPLSLPGLDDVR